MRVLAFWASAIIALGLAGKADTASADYTMPHKCAGAHVVYEDDYCFNWATMGNRHRGITDLRTGKFRVVGPCAYKRLWLFGNAGGPSLRGDWWAIVNGCK